MFLKHLCNENLAYIPCISLRKRLCSLRLARNSVICILFLDFVRFAISAKNVMDKRLALFAIKGEEIRENVKLLMQVNASCELLVRQVSATSPFV